MQNYSTTANLMDIAAKHMPKVRCFTYVSTAFVNFNQPDGTQVQEKLYPLFPDQPWEDDVAVAERLLKLPPERANAEVRTASIQSCMTQHDNIMSTGACCLLCHHGQMLRCAWKRLLRWQEPPCLSVLASWLTLATACAGSGPDAEMRLPEHGEAPHLSSHRMCPPTTSIGTESMDIVR